MSAQGSYHIDEGIIVEDDDWIEQLSGSVREEFCAKIKELDVRRLQRYPPQKSGAPYLGHEARVLYRHLTGNNALFDPSAFAGIYRRLASEADRNLYRALILAEPLPRSVWAQILGSSGVESWLAHKFLRESAQGLRSRFHAYVIGDLVLIGDTLKPTLLRRVLIGQDSFNMVHFLQRQHIERCSRYLDIGPGSGVILLSFAGRSEQAFGMDINPRAIAVSALNAELNGIGNVSLHEQNVLSAASKFEPFDLVTWNSPFVFLPEECKDTHYDGYGGYMGMEVVLDLLNTLPQLMTRHGRAFITASAPILNTGENLLEMALPAVARKHGLDISVHVLQAYWHGMYRSFHDRHNIRKFELVFLEIRRGEGLVRRVKPPFTTTVSDALREVVFRVLR